MIAGSNPLRPSNDEPSTGCWQTPQLWWNRKIYLITNWWKQTKHRKCEATMRFVPWQSPLQWWKPTNWTMESPLQGQRNTKSLPIEGTRLGCLSQKHRWNAWLQFNSLPLIKYSSILVLIRDSYLVERCFCQNLVKKRLIDASLMLLL
jgi:hypothetical protein